MLGSDHVGCEAVAASSHSGGSRRRQTNQAFQSSGARAPAGAFREIGTRGHRDVCRLGSPGQRRPLATAFAHSIMRGIPSSAISRAAPPRLCRSRGAQARSRQPYGNERAGGAKLRPELPRKLCERDHGGSQPAPAVGSAFCRLERRWLLRHRTQRSQ
jgi:hypothetical protein